MHTYAHWRDILQQQSFLVKRFQHDKPSRPAYHEIFRYDQVLVITAFPRRQVISVKLESLAELAENETMLWDTELVGPGILDDPLFYTAGFHAVEDEDEEKHWKQVRGLSIAFSRRSSQTGDYVCGGWDQWLFSDRPGSENMSIRDLVDISKNLALKDCHFESEENITIQLRMTADSEHTYAFFGGWIYAEPPFNTDQPEVASTNASIPYAHLGYLQLHWAAKLGNTVILNQLIRAGTYLERRWREIDGSTDRSWGTALLWAAIEGHISCMTALLDAGADLDPRNTWNRTPLHVAARFGHLDAVKLLVERGADIDARRDTQETPLHFAVEEDHYDVAEYLIGAGADIQAKGMRGTPLGFARALNRWRITELLVSHDAEGAIPAGRTGG
ncbi:Ankyrin-1 [Arthrobotrys entomopaga]|nr:Ankyrin-1 [Arthrobotrys entomopaga]